MNLHTLATIAKNPNAVPLWSLKYMDKFSFISPSDFKPSEYFKIITGYSTDGFDTMFYAAATDPQYRPQGQFLPRQAKVTWVVKR